MSRRNSLKNKAARRIERAEHKASVAPPVLLGVRKADVLGHRYLRDHGLPFSNRMASVELQGDRKVEHEPQT